MSGHIETIPASSLKLGDVFSTDGGVVNYLGDDDSGQLIYVEVICHGDTKEAILRPDFPCHLWRKP